MEQTASADLEELAECTPYWVKAERQLVGWLPMQQRPLLEPFFVQSVTAFQRSQPECPALLTSLDTMIALSKRYEEIVPSGFIFHMSRCGSTAVSRALAATGRVLVLSEPQPVSAVLGARGFADGAARDLWLRSLLNLLARARAPRVRQQGFFVIKFNSWNSLYLDDLRRLYPNVPWLFVFRHPVEVLVSLTQGPPGWLTVNPFWAEDLPASSTVEERAAIVLSRFCECALTAGEQQRLLVEHCDIRPDSLWRIFNHFRIELRNEEAAAAVAALGFYSKDLGSRKYVEDGEGKRARASAALRQAVERWLDDVYLRLRLAAADQPVVDGHGVDGRPL